MEYITVKKSGLSDSETFQKGIDQAVENGVYTVVVDGGEWNIEKTILIPDFVHLIIDGVKINYTGENSFIANSNSVTTYKNVIVAEQKGITITGKNQSVIKGTVFFNNVRNCTIENLEFNSVENGVLLTSTIGVKLKDLSFIDCKSGIVLASGASDVMINNIHGTVEKELINVDNSLYQNYKKLYHPSSVKNIIVRDICGMADTLVSIKGDAEKLIFNNVKCETKTYAFNVLTGKHIVINGVQTTSKIINEDYPKEQVVIY